MRRPGAKALPPPRDGGIRGPWGCPVPTERLSRSLLQRERERERGRSQGSGDLVHFVYLLNTYINRFYYV